jgi:hypothetical protein
MTRALAILLLFAAFSAVAGTSISCGAARSVRDRITGATPKPTHTPTYTPTLTPTATPTATPTPIPTPTPELPRNPQGLERWDTLPVPYCVSSDGDGYVSHDLFIVAVQRAFATWGVPVTYTGECGRPAQDDGANTIGWGVLDSEPDITYEAGVTQRTRSECRANCDPNDKVKLTEVDIIIDSSPPDEFRTANCLYATLLHETGHFLGLEHLPSGSVMEAETSGCRTKLTDADREALLQRYGERAHPQ